MGGTLREFADTWGEDPYLFAVRGYQALSNIMFYHSSRQAAARTHCPDGDFECLRKAKSLRQKALEKGLASRDAPVASTFTEEGKPVFDLPKYSVCGGIPVVVVLRIFEQQTGPECFPITEHPECLPFFPWLLSKLL